MNGSPIDGIDIDFINYFNPFMKLILILPAVAGNRGNSIFSNENPKGPAKELNGSSIDE